MKKKQPYVHKNMRDLFNTKFFIEDFLEDINTVSLLDYEEQEQLLQSVKSNHNFKRTITSRPNVNIMRLIN